MLRNTAFYKAPTAFGGGPAPGLAMSSISGKGSYEHSFLMVSRMYLQTNEWQRLQRSLLKCCHIHSQDIAIYGWITHHTALLQLARPHNWMTHMDMFHQTTYDPDQEMSWYKRAESTACVRYTPPQLQDCDPRKQWCPICGLGSICCCFVAARAIY